MANYTDMGWNAVAITGADADTQILGYSDTRIATAAKESLSCVRGFLLLFSLQRFSVVRSACKTNKIN